MKKTFGVCETVVLVAFLLLGMLPQWTADYWSTDAVAGYVLVGNTRVSRSLGVQTEEQLTERLRQGYVSVTFDDRLTEVSPLSYGEQLQAGNTVCPPYFRWWCGISRRY